MTTKVPPDVVELHRCVQISKDELRVAQEAFAKEARWWLENGGTSEDLGLFLINGVEKRDDGYYVKE